MFHRLPKLLFATAAFALVGSSGAHAQFGFDCKSVNFEQALLGAASDDKFKAATHATCAFWIRREATSFPQGWDAKRRIGEARDYVQDLNRLGDKAIELNFMTGDLRAIGNIKKLANDLSFLEGWLKDSERLAAPPRERTRRRGGRSFGSGSTTGTTRRAPYCYYVVHAYGARQQVCNPF